MIPEEAITRISADLVQIFKKKFGREPDPELVREEARELIKKFGPISEIKDIFN